MIDLLPDEVLYLILTYVGKYLPKIGLVSQHFRALSIDPFLRFEIDMFPSISYIPKELYMSNNTTPNYIHIGVILKTKTSIPFIVVYVSRCRNYLGVIFPTLRLLNFEERFIKIGPCCIKNELYICNETNMILKKMSKFCSTSLEYEIKKEKFIMSNKSSDHIYYVNRIHIDDIKSDLTYNFWHEFNDSLNLPKKIDIHPMFEHNRSIEKYKSYVE